MEDKREFNITPQELLRRLGMSQYEAKTTRIVKIRLEAEPQNVRIVTTRKVRKGPIATPPAEGTQTALT